MSTHSRSANDASPHPAVDPNSPTYAAFSPSTLGQATPQSHLRSAILVHQKSPLLAATPPQVTRVLAYSHPFIVPVNNFIGLLTWTSGDPWESFLLVASFWALVLYGDVVTRYAGPIFVVLGLILGMYARRNSALSSTGWTGEKGQQTQHKRAESESNIKHHKSLEEIVDTLKLFTSRCNILLDPLLRLTDFLSTQRTATSATTRPALTVLFIRILLVLPIWILLTLPPFYILTTKRVVLAAGTIFFTWHSRPARVSRTILWRSKIVRKTCIFLTGLDFGLPQPGDGPPALPPRRKSTQEIAASLAAKRRPDSPGVRFTFSIFENQRRWLGIGWTSSMLAYERSSWTDEHLNPTPSTEKFELPEVEGGHARWRWLQGSEWKIEGGDAPSKGDEANDNGWIYYDNKWRDGRRGQDGWGRYTRRRKWYRDAELVEVTPSTEVTPIPTPKLGPISEKEHPSTPPPEPNSSATTKPTSTSNPSSSAKSEPANGALLEKVSPRISDTDAASTKSRRSWFKKKQPRESSSSRRGSETEKADTIASSTSTDRSRRSEEDDVVSPLEMAVKDDEWRLGDDIRMQLDI